MTTMIGLNDIPLLISGSQKKTIFLGVGMVFDFDPKRPYQRQNMQEVI